jgi:hypothetical protein
VFDYESAIARYQAVLLGAAPPFRSSSM